MQYPNATWAKVSLFVADGTKGRWVQRSEVFCDDALEKQPIGRVGFYISDFLSPQGLPAALCRPSAAELAGGVLRFVPSSLPAIEDMLTVLAFLKLPFHSTNFGPFSPALATSTSRKLRWHPAARP